MVKTYAEGVLRYKWLIVLISILAIAGLASGARCLTFTND